MIEMDCVILSKEGLWCNKCNSTTGGSENFVPNGESVWTSLREACKIEEGTTLLDIFRIVDKYPMLKAFISQYSWCRPIDEFHAQAQEPMRTKDNEPIVALEIFWSVGCIENTLHFYADFHGFGAAFPDVEHPSGTGRQSCSVSACPLYDLAGLPVVLDEKILLDDSRTTRTMLKCFSLLDVLDAIYRDIGFHGGPVEKKAFFERLRCVANMYRTR
jgi:hypothetical protein